jgi:succinate dehydrogenase/fumarate reductase flavoprotein subunit
VTDVSYETVDTDVLVIGAGGAGMRGAIAAAGEGARVLVVCKSLLGKAHTAALGLFANDVNLSPVQQSDCRRPLVACRL